jgi:hypothetical protein
MSALDPATGRPLPESAIQRVLFVTNTVHVYQIPPITSTKGFSASSWTSPTQPTAQQIFVARLRIIETAIDGRLKGDVVLEDGSTGDLFAAAPYTSPAVVEQASDSSRFFAVRVQGEGGMKATLGIGFEDRSVAFDFGVALGEVRKVLGMEQNSSSGARAAQLGKKIEQEQQKDFSLKAGEKIVVQVGGKGRRPPPPAGDAGSTSDSTALFSIAPPPPAAGKAPVSSDTAKTAQELGFDDGEFGEFQ